MGYDRGPMLENIAYNVVVPSYELALTEVEALVPLVNGLDGQSTVADVDQIRTVFLKAYGAFSRHQSP